MAGGSLISVEPLLVAAAIFGKEQQTMNAQDSSFNAYEIGGQRIEVHEPNLTLAYAALAPLVLEAAAYLECGQQDLATESLRAASQVIGEVANGPMLIFRPKDLKEAGE